MVDQTPKEPKKSDTLQIRIPHETKQEFLEACRDDRVSASDVLRRSILDYLSLRKRPSSQPRKGLLLMIPQPIRKKRYLAAGAAAIGLAAFAVMPSAADPNFRTAFQRLDANGDGKLDQSEFVPMPFPNASLYREARVNDAKGLPKDVIWVEPGVRQDSIQREIALKSGELTGVKDDFRRFDANGDAAVSYDEFQASLTSMLQPVFDASDRNGDGKLNREELGAPITITAQLAAFPEQTPGPLPGGLPADEAFRIYDRNGDGKVTFEEYVPQP